MTDAVEKRAPFEDADADNTPHIYTPAAPMTCRYCGNDRTHPVHEEMGK